MILLRFPRAGAVGTGVLLGLGWAWGLAFIVLCFAFLSRVLLGLGRGLAFLSCGFLSRVLLGLGRGLAFLSFAFLSRVLRGLRWGLAFLSFAFLSRVLGLGRGLAFLSFAFLSRILHGLGWGLAFIVLSCAFLLGNGFSGTLCFGLCFSSSGLRLWWRLGCWCWLRLWHRGLACFGCHPPPENLAPASSVSSSHDAVSVNQTLDPQIVALLRAFLTFLERDPDKSSVPARFGFGGGVSTTTVWAESSLSGAFPALHD